MSESSEGVGYVPPSVKEEAAGVNPPSQPELVLESPGQTASVEVTKELTAGVVFEEVGEEAEAVEPEEDPGQPEVQAEWRRTDQVTLVERTTQLEAKLVLDDVLRLSKRLIEFMTASLQRRIEVEEIAALVEELGEELDRLAEVIEVINDSRVASHHARVKGIFLTIREAYRLQVGFEKEESPAEEVDQVMVVDWQTVWQKDRVPQIKSVSEWRLQKELADLAAVDAAVREGGPRSRLALAI